jgi:hypothetical protein
MSASFPSTGYQALIEADTGTSNAYQTVAQAIDIKFDGVKVNMVPVQDLSQIVASFIPGTIDYGTITCRFYYTPTLYATLIGLLRVQHNWRVTSGDGTTGSGRVVVPALIEDVSDPEFKHNEASPITVKLRTTGAFTLSTL